MDDNDIDLAHFMTAYVEFQTEEPPAGEYTPMTEDEARKSFMGFVADIWDEGFNTGHYLPSEKQDCDCRENPYREDA